MAARRFMLPGPGTINRKSSYTGQPLRELPIVADEPEVVDRIRDASNLRDEPEALDAQDYRLHINQRAKRDAEQQLKFETRQREQARRLMDVEQRMTAVREEARRRHIDVSSELRLLTHMRQSHKRVRHLEQRLGALERRIWRDAA